MDPHPDLFNNNEFETENSEQEPFYWSCPHCKTLNQEVTCQKCSFTPEYYIEYEPGAVGTKPNTRKNIGLIITIILGSCMVIMLVFGLFIFGLFFWSPGSSSVSSSNTAAVHTSSNSDLPVLSPTSTKGNSVPPGCKLWSDVTASDAGKTLCVYGTVYDGFSGDGKQYHVRFSAKSNQFQFIFLNGLQSKITKGDCIYQTDTIKAFSKMPYMNIKNDISRCKK